MATPRVKRGSHKNKEFRTLLREPTLLFQIKAGSELYGYGDKHSDCDVVQVYLPSMLDLASCPGEVDRMIERGNTPSDHERGIRKKPGEIDLKCMSLNKLLSKAAEGHMSHLELLFAMPEDFDLRNDQATWDEIADCRKYFITTKVVHHATAYLRQAYTVFEENGIKRSLNDQNFANALFHVATTKKMNERHFEALSHSIRIFYQMLHVIEGQDIPFKSSFYKDLPRGLKDFWPIAPPHIPQEKIVILRRALILADGYLSLADNDYFDKRPALSSDEMPKGVWESIVYNAHIRALKNNPPPVGVTEVGEIPVDEVIEGMPSDWDENPEDGTMTSVSV